jgi:exosome complex exonuclease RRP6
LTVLDLGREKRCDIYYFIMTSEASRADAVIDDGTSSECILAGEELLSNLMSALAAGARAVQGLPVDDDFDYHSSFPEFRSLVLQNQGDLLDTILLALTSAEDNVMVDREFQGLTDPLLWEACSDVCDWLTEQAEASGTSSIQREQLVAASDKAKSSFGQLMKGIVKMDKPQDVYNIYRGSNSYLNSRVEPFVPPITEKFRATEPLDLSLRIGHGIDNRFGAWRAAKALPQDIVAPSHHVDHAYQTEIENLKYTDWQLEAPASKPAKVAVATEPLEAMWVDTTQTLEQLTKELESASEIAVDLEAHNYRSFGGMTCLIQITIGATDCHPEPRNYLVDPFPLWQHLGQALGPAFTDPTIVKVMHGAESDVQWLQRDFGIYVVNLFDTYNAAKTLNLGKYGYAHLLSTYVGIIPDKSHQLADWRQRPLPPAMKEYAIMDTHYLLDIYQRLKYDLAHQSTASIAMVFDKSREVSLIRYVPDPFKPSGYKTLMNKRRTKSELSETQEQVLKELYDWRDQIARQYDESLIFVCENSKLLRLALACPTTLAALQALIQPMPPLLLRQAKQLLGIVQRCVKPPFFKPATNADADDEVGETERSQTRALMSPVLGTEALYRQAGWISPHNQRPDGDNDMVPDPIATTTDDDDADAGNISPGRPRLVLAVHETNQRYRSSQFTPHSLQLAHHPSDGTGVVDGRGPARVLHEENLDEETELAQSNAASIRTAQEKHAMYGLIHGPGDFEDGDADDEGGDDDDNGEMIAEENFVIPKSMREIYRISNHNRRKKKPSSPLTLKPKDKEAQELATAEEILKARAAEGKNYFDEIPGLPKRQRTRSTNSASSEENGPGVSAREDDIAMMEEVGWINGKEEAEAMLKQCGSAGEEDGDGAGISSEDDAGKQPKQMYDYTTVGSIGALCATPPSNPFFSGAATSGGYLTNQFGKPDNKKKQATNKSKQTRRQQTTERPERNQGRSQAFKKR